jgi:quercetin dioxygenase-like cupin family protein
MSSAAAAAEYLWFLNTLVCVRISEREGSDGLSVLEHRAPYGDSPPLHLHRTEDEIFYVLEGNFRFQVAGEERRLGSGESLLAPKGVPHTYRIESPAGGRWLTVTSKGDFERFVRAMSRVAERNDLPEPAGAPPPEAVEALSAAARTHGIELVGPPLH